MSVKEILNDNICHIFHALFFAVQSFNFIFFLASAFNNNKTLYVLIGHASHANPKKNILPIMFVVFCDETRN